MFPGYGRYGADRICIMSRLILSLLGGRNSSITARNPHRTAPKPLQNCTESESGRLRSGREAVKQTDFALFSGSKNCLEGGLG